jgi:hypothetical protein
MARFVCIAAKDRLFTFASGSEPTGARSGYSSVSRPTASFAMPRQRSKPHTFEGRIAAEMERLQARAAALPRGPELDALESKILQLETASHMNEWLRPPGQKPPE